MGLEKIVSRFCNSNFGKYVLDPKNSKKVNSTLPCVNQAVAEVFGIGICLFNPKMEKDVKKQQTIQHVIKAGLNMSIVSAVSMASANFADNVAKQLLAPESVKTGIRVGVPLVVATLVSRFAIPVFLNNFSTKIRDKFCNKNKSKDNFICKTMNVRELYQKTIDECNKKRLNIIC